MTSTTTTSTAEPANPVSDSGEVASPFTPQLGLFSATTLVAGTLIGSGIFLVTPDIARQVGSPVLLMLVWVFTAMLTLFGALSYGKLTAAFPYTGGQYVFLKKAWGDLPAFLYGWALYFVIQTGLLAAVAVAFSKFCGVIWPIISADTTFLDLGLLHVSTQEAVAIAVLAVLTLYNCTGIKEGALLQNVFTVIKVLALMGLIGLGLWFAQSHPFSESPWFVMPEQPLALPLICAFAVSTVGAIFSADAWNNVTFISSEIKNPRQTLPKALLIGTSMVLVLYILTNITYIYTLPFYQMQSPPEDRIATAMMDQIFGAPAAMIMAALILVSTFGCLNGMALAGARVFYAMAKDGLFFKAFGYLHPKFKTPMIALIGQGLWSMVLTLSGSYGQLLDYLIFTTLLFYMATVVGLFRLAKQHPDLIPMNRWIDKAIPITYIILTAYVAINLALFKQNYTLPGLGIVCLGIPIYWVWQRFYQRPTAGQAAPLG